MYNNAVYNLDVMYKHYTLTLPRWRIFDGHQLCRSRLLIIVRLCWNFLHRWRIFIDSCIFGERSTVTLSVTRHVDAAPMARHDRASFHTRETTMPVNAYLFTRSFSRVSTCSGP